jgi:hypothetical protein
MHRNMKMTRASRTQQNSLFSDERDVHVFKVEEPEEFSAAGDDG